MKVHLSNAAYGLLDYTAHPIGMLLIVPVVLRNLGIAQYGIWAVATAAVSAGSIIAAGFGDANIQQVATQRGLGDSVALLRVVRSTMAIHLIMGISIALVAWVLAPYYATHVTASDFALRSACLWSLRIASLLMLVRAVESVCISTQRAFERYGAAVRISILVRLLTLVVAAGLTYVNRSVVSIMAATAVLITLGVWLQLVRLKHLLHAESLSPAFDRAVTKALLAFGIFSWLQAVSGVLFGQADRLITGVSLGAAAVASYALCVQLTQPIYGLAASGLHFLFPYLTARRVTGGAADLRRSVLLAFSANLLLVAAGVGAVLLFGDRVLLAFAGASIAHTANPVLPIIAWSSALLGLNVTGSYALLALGRVKTVTWFNLGGGAAMMLLIAKLLPHYGMWGIAMARLSYGPITLLLYIPLVKLLRRGFSGPPAYDEQSDLEQRTRNEQIALQAKQVTHPAGTRCYANLLGVQVEALDMEQALAHVKEALFEHWKGYVSMIGVHGIMEAQRSPSLADAYANSILKIPDGMPTVWVGRSQGHKRMQRVAGPDLMLEIFRRKEFAGYTHFLYGGKQGIAEELAASFSHRFPWARILGTWTPPFRELTASEEEDLIATIGRLKPDIIWVGISTPKQDHFMRKYLPSLETTLMFGVGAAFDFHTGRIKDCAGWIKSAGMQWLHRLLQDPRRLWRRYLFNNPAFVWCIVLQLSGLRTYPLPSSAYTMERATKPTVADPRTVQEAGPML